jgi:hypothetical protein
MWNDKGMLFTDVKRLPACKKKKIKLKKYSLLDRIMVNSMGYFILFLSYKKYRCSIVAIKLIDRTIL